MARPFWLGGLLAVLAAATAAAQSPAASGPAGEKRVALVIGNAAYDQGALRNPVNDARAIVQALRGAGFQVIARENADRVAMYEAINEFGDRLKDTRGVGLFYFSGHGLQVQGKNFMVPLRARITSERMVEPEAVDVNRVLAEMDTAQARVNIVILDACRDNPYARSFRSGARGLAQIDAPRGTLIAYATAPGKVAEDGTGANSPYTAALVRHIQAPGLPIEGVFKRVRVEVLERTRNRQEPWEASSLTGDFLFFPAGALAAARPPEPSGPTVREEVRQELGSLALSARLDGVEVFLDDQRIGEARRGRALVVDNLAVGTYRLKARKTGHKDWEREVQVAANQRAEVAIDIEPLRPEPPAVTKTEDGAEMVLVPAGEFWMGSDAAEVERFKQECRKAGVSEESCRRWGEREAPRHRVHLDAFYIDRYEVTNALFEKFVRATGHRTTAEREGSGWAWQDKDGKRQWVKVDGAEWRRPSGPGSSTSADHPVVQVSWHDADAYCKWAGKRLPTEAEWEKAARGTDGRRYPWGEDWDPSKANGAMTVKTTRPVGSYSGGVSPYGAHDMAGNVLEWVADWLDEDYYKRSPERNPRGPDSGQYRVLRGGSWYFSPVYLRSAARSHSSPGYRGDDLGCRCARGL
jgi:formylglycine-generating enzyme required for sulfatase activity